jgi:hypothetical protein
VDFLRGPAEEVRHLCRNSRESQTCFRDETLRGKAEVVVAFRTDQALATFAVCDKILHLQCETQHEVQVEMIEFSESQWNALTQSSESPLQIVNPITRERFVLLRAEEFARLSEIYDDSDWTREERESLSAAPHQGENWGEYDDIPEKS